LGGWGLCLDVAGVGFWVGGVARVCGLGVEFRIGGCGLEVGGVGLDCVGCGFVSGFKFKA